MRCDQARGDEDGQAGAEVIAGCIVLVIGLVFVFSNLWMVLDAKMAVSGAARNAAQAYVEQNSASEAESAAQTVARSSLAPRFSDRWRAETQMDRFARCQPISVRVSVTLPLIAVPFLGSLGGTKTVSATHASRIDPFRSGVPGEVDCGV